MTILNGIVKHILYKKIMPNTRSKGYTAPIKLTDTVCVGDRSYSMVSTNGGSQEGSVQYMRTQRDAASTSVATTGNYVQYVSFDSVDHVVYFGDSKDITEDDLGRVYENMKPRGGTRLYDTIHKYLNQQMNRIDETIKGLSKEVKGLVNDNMSMVAATFAVITDGNDNESTITSLDCKKLFKKYKDDYGGIALFIAANQNASATANLIGIDENNALQMGNDRDSSINAAKAVAQAQVRMVSGTLGGGNGETFTQYERQVSDNNTGSSNNTGQPTMASGGLGGGDCLSGGERDNTSW